MDNYTLTKSELIMLLDSIESRIININGMIMDWRRDDKNNYKSMIKTYESEIDKLKQLSNKLFSQSMSN